MPVRAFTRTADRLMPAERIMLAVTLALAAAGGLLWAGRGYAVDWAAYGPVYAVGALLVAAALWYRANARSPEIAATLAATGCYILFAAIAAKLNYLLLPIWRAPESSTALGAGGAVIQVFSA